jgi:mono/diheme cytochrome c family protein
VILKRTALALLATLLLIQLVPYGRDHTNPTGGRDITWDSVRTQELMRGACMDCHSNETQWPWYSNVAPVSWLVQNDVDGGRRHLNLSTGEVDLHEMIQTIQDGSMPPWQYKPAHAAARLSARDRQELIRGLQATFGGG